MRPSNHPLSHFIQHTTIVEPYPPKAPQLFSPQPKPRFFQDQIFQKIERTDIVERYMVQEQFSYLRMEQQPQRMEEQPYQQLVPNQQQTQLAKINRRMLDQSSSDRQLPARNSSISSLSQENYPPSPLMPVRLGHHINHQSNHKNSGNNQINHQNFLLNNDLLDDAFNLQGRVRLRREVDSSAQRRQRLNKIKKIQQIGCNCKKSRCLKMYCECFNLQILCTQNCNCVDCGNKNKDNSHQKAVLDALTRNPKAFAEEAQTLQPVFELGLQLSEVRRGCKCRKTKCLKKYCQCFNSGQKCGIFCQCEDCHNGKETTQAPLPGPMQSYTAEQSQIMTKMQVEAQNQQSQASCGHQRKCGSGHQGPSACSAKHMHCGC